MEAEGLGVLLVESTPSLVSLAPRLAAEERCPAQRHRRLADVVQGRERPLLLRHGSHA